MVDLPIIHICLIHPDGYRHGDALLDPAMYFKYQFERFGCEVTFERNRLRHGAVNFIFGAHNGFSAALCRSYSCVFVNLEQVGAGGANLPHHYLSLLANSAVVDYDAANPPAYTAYPQDVPVVSFGYAPYLADVETQPLESRPIDILFFGSLNERRIDLIRRIEAAGRKVTVAPVPLYGYERDTLIRQAKCVVNLPFYESARFEQVRAFLCLSLGTPVLSERRLGTQPPEAFETSVTWFDELQIDQLFGSDFGTPDFYAIARRQLEAFGHVDPVSEYADAMYFAAGIWQVHQKTEIGQTSHDVTLHFDARGVTASAAPLLARHRSPKEASPVFQYLDEAALRVDQCLGAARYDDALNVMALAVHNHFCQASVAHHGLYYPDFDLQIAQLSRALTVDLCNEAPLKAPAEVTLIIATELYQVGGHSKVVEDVARAVNRPVIVLTDLFSSYKSGRLDISWVLEKFQGLEVICLDNDTLWEKCHRIGEIAADLPVGNVVYVQHHQDPLPFVGTLGHPSARKVLVHHCDHNPSLGCTLQDVRHADLSEFLQETCSKHLGHPVHLLPLHVSDRGRLPSTRVRKQEFSVVTSGRPGKFQRMGPLALHEIVSTVLRQIDGSFFFIGPLEEEWLAAIRHHLQHNDLDPGRFVPLGLVSSLWDSLLKLDVAFYLGSAPIGGGRAAIEAQGAGLPVLFFSGIAPGTLIENYSVYANPQLGWSNLAHLEALLREIGPCSGELGDQARQYYEEHFSERHFLECLSDLLGEDAMA